MSLITRQGKGSKLTIQEMDGNLNYLDSVASTQENYNNYKGVLNGAIVGTVHKKMVETPLTFIRAKEQPVFCSGKDQGTSFGFTLVDYRSSTPLVIAVIRKSENGYLYSSIMLDKESNSYITSENLVKDCDSIKALTDYVSESVNLDVDKWINKY